jgi:hypothetical protein
MHLPLTQIHLDFHTSPLIPGIAAQFDAAAWAAALRAAEVRSVTVFAKCHHGHLYYPTKRPERHPGLAAGRDLLGEQIRALHAVGIRAPVYLSVLCDEWAMEHHPEWQAVDREGRLVSTYGWRTPDVSSPYLDFLCAQTEEVLRRYRPVDGVFFDMTWDQRSLAHYAVAGMRAAGLDPDRDADVGAWAERAAAAAIRRLRALVKRFAPKAPVFFNCRGWHHLHDDLPVVDHVEIESLPSGNWGYLHFNREVRRVRHLGKPYLGMTGRFHKAWGDFGGYKPYPALEYETSRMVAHGAAVSVGDQLHPDGRPDPATSALVGRAFRRLVEREPWLTGATPLAEVALLEGPSAVEVAGTIDGWTRLLIQLRQQWEIVRTDAAWERYALVILPDGLAIDDGLAARLAAYATRGGKILSGAFTRVLPGLGTAKAEASPFTVSYLRGAELGPGDHALYGAGERLRPARGARVLGQVVEPYFERTRWQFCSHLHTPPAAATAHAGATVGRHGARLALSLIHI